MIKLVLIRHGESTWNRENRFTGWTDVPLTEEGMAQARKAGRLLKEEGYEFDYAFASVLKRANETLRLVLKEMGEKVITERAWQLNERHYGGLQGLNKAEMAAKYGEAQVLIWRRSYDTRPPALELADSRHPSHDSLYKDVDQRSLPSAECLKDTVARVLPYWNRRIVPMLKGGKRLIIAAHGNSLRALVKHLDGISDQDIVELNIPVGMPLVYELDDSLKPIKHYYLGDPEEIRKAIESVKSQGKAK